MQKIIPVSICLLFGFCLVVSGQTIYDESEVPEYTLPPVLVDTLGSAKDTSGWALRRTGLLEQFANQVYGKAPDRKPELRAEAIEGPEVAMDGLGLRQQTRLWLKQKEDSMYIDLLIYVPIMDGPAPVFMGLNFNGNHTIHEDPAILITQNWVSNNEQNGIKNHKALASMRGARAGRWPVEYLLKSGYGLVTAYYGDIDPDYDDNFQNGIHALMAEVAATKPDSNEWGSLAGWAYGESLMMDYLEKESLVDEKRVALIGHSRLGKAALWAGANDERFALVISNNSGCGGAALSRRQFGETVGAINDRFPHWFCDNFARYNQNEAALPLDQHQLLALIAPRPLYVASASEDRWADPTGEFLSLQAASIIYALQGLGDLRESTQPAVNSPMISKNIAYHLREGRHDLRLYDWRQYVSFTDQHLK